MRRLSKRDEKWLVPTLIGTGALVMGGISYGIVRLFGSGWPSEGDRCSIDVYANTLGRHDGRDAVIERAWKYMPLLRYAARYFNIEPTLLAGLVHTESGWNPTAGSSAGAVGLSQHIPSTAVNRFRILAEQNRWPFTELRTNNDPQANGYLAKHDAAQWVDRTDPKQSLWLGAASMRSLLDYGKGVEWALAAYNAGPAAANKPREQWPAETRAYVPGVLKRQRWYQELDAACRAA